MARRKGIRNERIDAVLGLMRRQFEIDERKYKDVLELPYYFGYLDGQRRMIRLLEANLSTSQSGETECAPESDGDRGAG